MKQVSRRSQVFIIFISVFVMKINYTKIKYKRIYESNFLSAYVRRTTRVAYSRPSFFGGGRASRCQQLLRIAGDNVAKGELFVGIPRAQALHQNVQLCITDAG
ncbi:hypothetical protein ALP96_102895 [Pseudomonas savastanoi pv. glycinea]|uniref:Uncharacterized protein n=1 Tax=Pseudomonas savastanoi pv. glycinea TaxID=318 RepID=A0A3M4TZS8_PSESG|nr:hypothetical protein ALQ75_103297 [Pseudomonas savastanoi pv. glycinea]RMM90129.1 hypothetical protein ALQ70_102784 [Pseudomonas savastanoi pv. glycinea]RMM95958.1 hypothetical protein ALQ69_103592 [Pseudomonas savastanoi pv. glycinea]RMO32092.1 hypothetical protein ALQ43_102785 [Pseudomonas savastanoi pv. glycinea]RMO38662.1 hypothetical protein ALQ42_102582 [Pseudomonas savastanoi pv. glycinea]